MHRLTQLLHGRLSSVLPRLSYEPTGIALPVSDLILLNGLENPMQTLKVTGRLEDIAKQRTADTGQLMLLHDYGKSRCH